MSIWTFTWHCWATVQHGDIVSAEIGPALWGSHGSWKSFELSPCLWGLALRCAGRACHALDALWGRKAVGRSRKPAQNSFRLCLSVLTSLWDVPEDCFRSHHNYCVTNLNKIRFSCAVGCTWNDTKPLMTQKWLELSSSDVMWRWQWANQDVAGAPRGLHEPLVPSCRHKTLRWRNMALFLKPRRTKPNPLPPNSSLGCTRGKLMSL